MPDSTASIHEETKQLLEKIRPPEPISGFLILFDIKDSTIRKQQKKEMWYHHTKMIYSLFDEFVKNLCNQLFLDEIVIKYSGDGLMTFLKTRPEQQQPLTEIAQQVFEQATTFVTDKIYGGYAQALDDMRFKSVFSYAQAYQVPYDQNDSTKQDVIGNEIDLAFRFEKFADDTHFIINEGLAKLLDKSLQSYSTQTRHIEFRFISCEKLVKGFEKPQTFYALCNIDHLRTTIENKKYSSSRDDITEELLGFVAVFIRPNSSSDEMTQSLVTAFDND